MHEKRTGSSIIQPPATLNELLEKQIRNLNNRIWTSGRGHFEIPSNHIIIYICKNIHILHTGLPMAIRLYHGITQSKLCCQKLSKPSCHVQDELSHDLCHLQQLSGCLHGNMEGNGNKHKWPEQAPNTKTRLKQGHSLPLCVIFVACRLDV